MIKNNPKQYFYKFHMVNDILSRRKLGKPIVPFHKETDSKHTQVIESGEGDEESDCPPLPPIHNWIVRIR